MSKFAIISGRYPNTSFDSVVNHRIYADRYDLTYIHCNWPTKHKNLYFNKLQYLLEYIDIFDAIFWIDDDAFFIDFNIIKYSRKYSSIDKIFGVNPLGQKE